MSSPPLTQKEYFATHGAAVGFPADLEQGRKDYDFNMTNVRLGVQSSEAINQLVNFLQNLPGAFIPGHPDLLFNPPVVSDLRIYSKPYDSVLSKVYRQNYIHNKNWPSAPKVGFVELSGLYGRLNDLIRTRLVCKYMDGPEFVSDRLKSYCASIGLNHRHYAMASEGGYYAWHNYIKLPVQVMVGGAVVDVEMPLEVQITTQLAEVISALTHGLYEGTREANGRPDESWKWQPETQRFRSTYLGHSLHLLEGIIQEFRRDVIKGTAAPEPSPVPPEPGSASASGPQEEPK